MAVRGLAPGVRWAGLPLYRSVSTLQSLSGKIIVCILPIAVICAS